MKLRSVARPAAILLGTALLGGCAKQETPPGHAPDFDAPTVVEMHPALGAAVPDLDEDAYVRFDEPLGDPRSLERSLITSPAWRYVVRVGRRSARIRPRDGWRPGVVYHFTIPPGLRDLIRNQTKEPIEFLFSTGETITSTSTTGRVLDRTSVRAVKDARVLVMGADSVPYTAIADTGGSFSLASLPTGSYQAFAFQDRNRNLLLDRDSEPHDSGSVELPEDHSAARLEFWLIPPDSTPPRLVSAEATDSLRLVLQFDEPLEPEYPLDSAAVIVRRQDSGEGWPLDTFVVGQLPVPEPLPTEAPPEGVAAPTADLQEPTDTTTAAVHPEDERVRPQSFVTVLLARPLLATSYAVSATGFANLRLLVGGGDTTFVYEALPPELVPAAADSIQDETVTQPERGEP